MTGAADAREREAPFRSPRYRWCPSRRSRRTSTRPASSSPRPPAQGAQLAVLPEWFCLMGRAERDKLAIRERDGDGPIQSFLARTAAQHRRVADRRHRAAARRAIREKVRNSCLVYDAAGQRVARYDKIHLFDFTDADEKYRESNTIEPGDAPVAIDSPFGRIALSICYDVRFPELYRGLAPMDLIVVPSAFTATTGAAHWELLLRARAVENLAWVIAPAQGGHAPQRPAHPRSHDDRRSLGRGGRQASRRGPGCCGRRHRPQLPAQGAREPARARCTACFEAFPQGGTMQTQDQLLKTASQTLLAPYDLEAPQLEQVFGAIMTHDVDYADLYFQYLRSEGWSLEEGIVKSGSFNIDQGVGVRAIAGEKTAFAYSDEISLRR